MRRTFLCNAGDDYAEDKDLLKHISNNPDEDRKFLTENKKIPERQNCIFNEYFRKEKDEIILKILTNVFGAVQKVWADEWSNPDKYILTKTNGYSGIMKVLPSLYKKGKEQNALTLDFFVSIFKKVKLKMKRDNIEFTIEHFEPSAKGEAHIRDLILEEIQ